MVQPRDFASALPPAERWYQRIEHRSHYPPHSDRPVVKYTAALPRGLVAPHMVTRRVYMTAFVWRGGTLSRSALIEAWHALLSSRLLLQSTMANLAHILPNRSAHVQAHLAAVLGDVDAAIRTFRHDLAELYGMECTRSLPSSWRVFEGADPVLDRTPHYGDGVNDGLFRAALLLLASPVHPRIAGAIETARKLADSLAPGKWGALQAQRPPSPLSSTPELMRYSTISLPLSAPRSPPPSPESWSSASRHSSVGMSHSDEDPAETFRRAWPRPGSRWQVAFPHDVNGTIAIYSGTSSKRPEGPALAMSRWAT